MSAANVPSYGRRSSGGGGVWSQNGQHETRTPGDRTSAYEGESYYGRPAIKRSHYGWLIISYLFTGGVAGAAQIIATMADLTGRESLRGLVRTGRWLALAGSLASPMLLILDLHTPKRWYNMMRIFRSSSPMSIGSWTLALFGSLSGLTAIGQGAEDFLHWRWARWVSRLAGAPAAATGMVLSTYTGGLLASTSVPLWASAYRLLPPLFGASAASTGTAAASLVLSVAGGSDETHDRLERLALVASAAELGLALAVDQQWKKRGTDSALGNGQLRAAYRFGAKGAGILAPLAIHGLLLATRKRSRAASMLASILALGGGYVQRAVMIKAGNRSADMAEQYLAFTQPGMEISEPARPGRS